MTQTHYAAQIFHLFVLMLGLSVAAVLMCMMADGDIYRYMDRVAELIARVRVRIRSRF